jgi:predicted nucleotidyltransferase
MSIQKIKAKIVPIFENENIVKAAIFGSYAIGKTKKDSDVDLIVEFGERKSLFDLVGLKLELEKILKKKVDLLTYKSIHPLLKSIILKKQKIIYEKKS